MITFDFSKTPITQVADTIIINAAKMGASDIHFDPREAGLMIRYRVDGDLLDYAFVPKTYERNLSTRLKLLANMNITETRLPQDGAIKGEFGDLTLDMRVSSLPTNEGEKIVIRILDYSMSLSGIDKLGFNKTNFEKLKRMIDVPNGIILVTGATGSGKSTTVYSILQVLNKEKTNIITVEDPIEMNIEGMNQVQVNSDIGLNFATVLRSILRQDPNIILIGEIRDSETAKIAVRASITGHLVLSTIHTNNSLSTIERLLDMNVERYLLSSAFTGIISQRLAKMICPHCRIKRPTTLYEKKVFKLALDKNVLEIYDANHNGCSKCNKGYHGRMAIQEVLEIDEEIRNMINNPKVNREDLRNLVYGSNHVITMLQDGLYKVLDGFTSFEEIYRIIEIDNDIEDSYSEKIPADLSIDEVDNYLKKKREEIEQLKQLYTLEENNPSNGLDVSNKAVSISNVNNLNNSSNNSSTPIINVNPAIKSTNAKVSSIGASFTPLNNTQTNVGSIIPNPNLGKIIEANKSVQSSNSLSGNNVNNVNKVSSQIIPNPNLEREKINKDSSNNQKSKPVVSATTNIINDKNNQNTSNIGLENIIPNPNLEKHVSNLGINVKDSSNTSNASVADIKKNIISVTSDTSLNNKNNVGSSVSQNNVTTPTSSVNTSNLKPLPAASVSSNSSLVSNSKPVVSNVGVINENENSSIIKNANISSPGNVNSSPVIPNNSVVVGPVNSNNLVSNTATNLDNSPVVSIDTSNNKIHQSPLVPKE